MSAFPRPESVELLQPTGTTQTARLPGLGEASLAEFRQAMAVESSQTNCLAAGFPDAQFCSVAPDRLGHQPAPEIAPLPVSPIGYTMWHHGNTGVGSAATADADLYSATRFGRRSDSVGDQFVSTALAASTLSNLEALALAQAGPPAINNRDTNDGHGNAIRTGTRGGIQVYCRDESGEWDSTDGRTWMRRGSNGNRIWHGRIEIDGEGNYITRNSDSGVTATRRSNGHTVRSTTTENGTTFEVRSTDNGTTWTNTSNGRAGRIDQYGQYLETEGTSEVVRGRSRELSQVIARQEALTREFGIRFRRPGEQVEYDGRTHTLRPPTMEELDCIQSVLRQNRQMNVRDMSFSFIQASSQTDNIGLWGVHRHRGNNGSPEILLFPQCNVQIRGWNGLEGTLQHELVHHEQTLSWGEGNWGTGANRAATNRILRDFGWTYDEASGRYRLLDRDRGQWQYNRDSGRWDPMLGGTPTPERSISNDEMRRRAQVHPSTSYFNLPWETHAEAQAMYRQDPRQLFGEGAYLFNLMKRYDQDLINSRFGTQGGQPRMIRGVNGDVVPNTAENRRSLRVREQEWLTAPPLPGNVAQRQGRCSCCA